MTTDRSCRPGGKGDPLLPVPGGLRRRLWLAVCGAGLFLLTACAEGATRPDFDGWHQSVSALSLGPDGWIQNLSFLVFGLLVLSTAPVWRRILVPGKGDMAFPVLTATTGTSLLLCAFVPQDPAPGYDPMGLALGAPTATGLAHLALAGVAALGSVAGMLVMARRFHGDPAWRGWSLYSSAMAVAMLGCIVVYGIWSLRPTGYAGTFERLAMLVTPVWGATLLGRLGRGVPFMRGPADAGG